MAGFHDRNEASVAAEAENWLARLPREDRVRFCLAANGDLLVFQGEVPEPVERRKLVLALATQSWQDRKSVVLGQSGTVRVDLGGRRNVKKKTNSDIATI